MSTEPPDSSTPPSQPPKSPNPPLEAKEAVGNNTIYIATSIGKDMFFFIFKKKNKKIFHIADVYTSQVKIR